MAEQDAKDINQMMSATADVAISSPKKSKFVWIVLACVVLGVVLGIVVYQQSIKTATKPTTTPRPSITTAKPSPIASALPSPVKPATNEVTPVANSITFPKSGKIRVFHTLNNIQMLLELTVNGAKQTITLPAKPVSQATPANFADSTFEVTAGTSATLIAYLNSSSGPKLRGWIPPQDSNNMKECGVPGGVIANNESEIAYIKTLLAGETIFNYQCWEDDDVPGEFNDLYMVWTYAPGTASPSPVVSASSSPASSAVASPSPSASASPSPKVSSSPTPTASPRVVMPDTSEGTPVTGVFEVTVGAISVGLILLVLGLFGLLAI